MCKYIISRLNLFFLTIKDNCSDIIGKNVPYTITFHARDFVILLLSVIILSACERHSPVGDQMDIAEKLMNSKPDSALSILENIPSSSVKDPRISARYAMLKSMALDKNYIDTTNFDVLQPAIDYYFLKTELQTRNLGHIIIKEEFIKTKVMMMWQCNLS